MTMYITFKHSHNLCNTLLLSSDNNGMLENEKLILYLFGKQSLCRQEVLRNFCPRPLALGNSLPILTVFLHGRME